MKLKVIKARDYRLDDSNTLKEKMQLMQGQIDCGFLVFKNKLYARCHAKHFDTVVDYLNKWYNQVTDDTIDIKSLDAAMGEFYGEHEIYLLSNEWKLKPL